MQQFSLIAICLIIISSPYIKINQKYIKNKLLACLLFICCFINSLPKQEQCFLQGADKDFFQKLYL